MLLIRFKNIFHFFFAVTTAHFHFPHCSEINLTALKVNHSINFKDKISLKYAAKKKGTL